MTPTHGRVGPTNPLFPLFLTQVAPEYAYQLSARRELRRLVLECFLRRAPTRGEKSPNKKIATKRNKASCFEALVRMT